MLPRSTEEVQGVVRLCARDRIPFVARGAGTGLSGGALPAAGGIVISLARMNRILDSRYREPAHRGRAGCDQPACHAARRAPQPLLCARPVVAAGLHHRRQRRRKRWWCALSQIWLHSQPCAWPEVVLPDGEVVHLGSAALDTPGYDLRGIFIGAEGTLGIATKITLRVIRRAELVQTLLAAFRTTDEAGAAVSDIIAAGILPAAIEMMDNLSIEAAEAAVHAGYPLEAGGLLLVELDGPQTRSRRTTRHGARDLRT